MNTTTDITQRDRWKFRVTPAELLHRRSLLTIKEAAYCLNISPSRLYWMISVGEIMVTRGRPLRVPVTEVKRCVADVGYSAEGQ